MEVKDEIAVVTGAAGAGAKVVVCADLDDAGAQATAQSMGRVARRVNVVREDDIEALIVETEAQLGRQRHGPRDRGYLLNTASAAGLLSQVGSAPYAVTKLRRRWPGRVAGGVRKLDRKYGAPLS